MRHERALRYLLEREADLTGRCEDLQNRLRRKNLRIYQVPEDCEREKKTVEFVMGLLTTALQLPQDTDIKIGRAHRALAAKLKYPATPPWSIIVRFLGYAFKDDKSGHRNRSCTK